MQFPLCSKPAVRRRIAHAKREFVALQTESPPNGRLSDQTDKSAPAPINREYRRAALHDPYPGPVPTPGLTFHAGRSGDLAFHPRTATTTKVRGAQVVLIVGAFA